MSNAAKRTQRYLGLDLSTSPGMAVIDVKTRKPTLVTAQSIATTTKHTDAQRYAYIEAFAIRMAHEYGTSNGFDAIIREDFGAGRNKRARQTVFGAWAAVDTALARYGLAVTHTVGPTEVKRIVVGAGNADKAEVETAVRKILGLPADYKFATDDESDACAVALAYLIREKLIDV